ncbi:hypothetical protein [Streptomyces sp. NPDC056468]|uniref:hypothetical protein n=1 Tax=Streptomyces sp. NPDC056468 TaxID=3345830 RepID=UPI0036811F6A
MYSPKARLTTSFVVVRNGGVQRFAVEDAILVGVQVDYDDQAGVSQSGLESLACDDETTGAAYVPLGGLRCGRQG